MLCDRLATEPADPDKPADVKGTPVIAPSDIATAIKFCKIASASSRRALYQLGRAYAANRQLAEAIERLPQGGRQRQHVGHGRTRRAVRDRQRASPRTRRRRASCSSARPTAGNPRGVANLAALSGGGGAPPDPVQARDLLAKAAEANSEEAQFQLGMMYAEGSGGPKDDVAARALFEKAAAQGHAEAMVWSGAFAQLGRGGPEDTSAAKAYYQKAAALGNEEAKARLKRLECPYVLKDKRGNVMTNLCF